MIIRAAQLSDSETLVTFLGSVPEQDRNFFKQDISDPEIVQRWLSDPRSQRFIALDDEGPVVATVAVIRGSGWSDHVGELELIVLPNHRNRGLGRTLARHGLVEALRMGLTNIFVEVAAEQTPLVAMFGRLGFEPEALLRDFVRDRRGEHHDLLVLTHRVRETWSQLLTLGVGEATEVS
jgi:ribosomal protein S18 acetylase RimI-like enzyme